MADVASLADMIRKASYYQNGGQDPENTTAAHFEQGLHLAGEAGDVVNKAISNVLAIKKQQLEGKKAGLENQKLEQELKSGERSSQPIRLIFGESPDKNKVAGTEMNGETITTAPKVSNVPAQLAPYKDLTLDQGTKAASLEYMSQKPEIAFAGLEDKKQRALMAEKRFQDNMSMRKHEYELNRALRTDRLNADIVGRFNSDPDVKKADQSAEASITIRELALSGNPIAASAIPTYSARMSGEVGNLSEADKRPFGGTQAILPRLDAAFQQMAEGTLTEENKKFIIDLTYIIQKRAGETLDNQASRYSKQYGQIGAFGNEAKVKELIRPTVGIEDKGNNDPLGIR